MNRANHLPPIEVFLHILKAARLLISFSSKVGAKNSPTLGCHVNCGLDSQLIVGCDVNCDLERQSVGRCGQMWSNKFGRNRTRSKLEMASFS